MFNHAFTTPLNQILEQVKLIELKNIGSKKNVICYFSKNYSSYSSPIFTKVLYRQQHLNKHRLEHVLSIYQQRPAKWINFIEYNKVWTWRNKNPYQECSIPSSDKVCISKQSHCLHNHPAQQKKRLKTELISIFYITNLQKGRCN